VKSSLLSSPALKVRADARGEPFFHHFGRNFVGFGPSTCRTSPPVAPNGLGTFKVMGVVRNTG
jgi:hypothetical protein